MASLLFGQSHPYRQNSIMQPESSSGQHDEVYTIQDVMNSLGIASTTSPSKKETGLEYLFDEDDNATKSHRQSFGSRLAYGIGMTYFSGLAFGGLWGLSEGLITPGKYSTRMRWNMILNSCTRRGPFLANNLGLIAFFYNGTHGALLKAFDMDQNFFSTTSCASLAGIILRSSSGIKPALLAGLVTGSAMGSFDFIRNYNHYLKIIREFLGFNHH